MRNPYKKPRVAYCTGCGVIFTKMHFLVNHRRTERCGGRFLSEPERANFTALRLIREEQERIRRVIRRTAK